MTPTLLLLGSALAQPLDLSYETALETALARNPTLLGAKLDLDSADGVLLAAKGIFDPLLTGNTSSSASTSESIREFGEVLSEFRSLSWDLGVNQTLPTGTNLGLTWATTQTRFKYELRDTDFVIERNEPLFESRMVATITQSLLEGYRLSSNLEGVRQAEGSRAVAEVQRDATRQQILADTAGAYWNLRYQQRLAEIARHSLDTAREEQRVVHAQVEQGRLAPFERPRVDAAVVQADSERITSEDAALAAADTLLLLIGEAPGQGVTLVTEPADPIAIHLDLDVIVKTALEHNPDLRIAAVQESSADLALANARHRRLPQLDLNGRYALVGYEPSSSAATTELFNGDLPEWSVGAAFSMPLLDRADRGQHLASQAEAAKARITRQTLERTITQQVRAQARVLTAAHAQVALAQANLQYAQDTLEAERALREAGRAILKDVLESISVADDARLALERALADYQQAMIELERLKGTL